MTKMLLCGALALAGLTAGCGTLADRDGTPMFGPPSQQSQYREVTYVEDSPRYETYRVEQSPPTTYRVESYPQTTYRVESYPQTTTRVETYPQTTWRDETYRQNTYTVPAGPGTPSGERYRSGWDGLTLGQRYQMEREGRYWDGQNWRTR